MRRRERECECKWPLGLADHGRGAGFVHPKTPRSRPIGSNGARCSGRRCGPGGRARSTSFAGPGLGCGLGAAGRRAKEVGWAVLAVGPTKKDWPKKKGHAAGPLGARALGSTSWAARALLGRNGLYTV